jgi:hypothetical protein
MNSTGNLEETEDMNAPVYEAMEEEEVHIPDYCFRCGHLEQELEAANKENEKLSKENDKLKGKKRSFTPYGRNMSVRVPDQARV